MSESPLKSEAIRLVKVSVASVAGARNEANLRHELEKALEISCKRLQIPWAPFQLERSVKTAEGRTKYVDVAHGAVIIEYEAPNRFGTLDRYWLKHAQDQAAQYAQLLEREEGRKIESYILVAWDGSSICFGRLLSSYEAVWEQLVFFDQSAAERLLRFLKYNGRPLVHPLLLSALVGPESDLGISLLPVFFTAARKASRLSKSTKTKLLFFEWRRLFGQVAGVQSDRLRKLLTNQAKLHHQPYKDHPAEYIFALHTYIALVAKIIAARALPSHSEDIANAATALKDRMEALESGRLFSDAGITNMLNGDFFSWYWDDESWPQMESPILDLIGRLAGLNFDMSIKNPDSTRDLFKGIYQTFVPGAVRHALGEYYTPDWLASRALDLIEWQSNSELLDPTCGSGTFLLEALKRRLRSASAGASASDLLTGLYGIDLNPLAVIAARASLIVFLAARLNPSEPIRLPVFLADAINPAETRNEIYKHSLLTEQGIKDFGIPRVVVQDVKFFRIFARIRELIDAELDGTSILPALFAEFEILNNLSSMEQGALSATIRVLVDLHKEGWNGIWCSILADRFAAAAISPVKYVCGNPPWVKWSNLPPQYAEFIKPRCLELGVFSEDKWVGGIESDISTVITYEVGEKWLADNGILGFFITGPVFFNESSQGFRRFRSNLSGTNFQVLLVEDFQAIRPFEGVNNHATFFILRKGQPSNYPIPYLRHIAVSFSSLGAATLSTRNQVAAPVPGTDSGPWLIGTKREHRVWKNIFRAGERWYRARKGITADRNGIFFVRVKSGPSPDECFISNDPKLGKNPQIPTITLPVEKRHIFPLLRGRGVKAFTAQIDKNYHVLVPQRSMHGDPMLPVTAPKTYKFLSRFKTELEQRSSLKRFQKGQPYWSLWSTGPYTFSSYKVAWREMPGGKFAAAIVRPLNSKLLGRKPVVPDHKLYFIPCESLPEAAYLAGLLNAPVIATAISSYAAQLSLGVSVAEYLAIPRFDANNQIHARLAKLSLLITEKKGISSPAQLEELDSLALEILSSST